jgi:hypothetical protein
MFNFISECRGEESAVVFDFSYFKSSESVEEAIQRSDRLLDIDSRQAEVISHLKPQGRRISMRIMSRVVLQLCSGQAEGSVLTPSDLISN